jgi:hypothetical protein
LFDFIIGSFCIIVSGGNPIREDTDVDIFSINCMSGERATHAEHFIVRVSGNTEHGHTNSQVSN